MHINLKNGRGFTIVELLIVIVVIAILAAISIVAYNGIQTRSRASAAQSAATSLDKKVEIYNAENGQYPTAAGSITSAASTTSWHSPQGSAFTTTAGAAGTTNGVYNALAAPADPKAVYYTNATSTGGCVWWYDYQNTTWKSMAAGTATCTLPTSSATSLVSVVL